MRYRRRRKYNRRNSLKRAWRRKRRPRQKSALVRQTEANRKAIKELKETREVKYERDIVANAQNNFIGQTLVAQVVDNYGLCQDSQNWVALTPPLNGYLNDIELYSPLWVCPTVIKKQGVSANDRIGNEVTMRSLNIKGCMIPGSAFVNGGIYLGMPQKQFLHMYVLLDKSPPQENTTGSFLLDSIPAQTFQYDPSWNSAVALSTGITPVPYNLNNPDVVDGTRQHLKSVAYSGKNPSGIDTGEPTSKDLLNLSYWSKFEGGIANTDRFKILLHKKYSATQSQIGTNVPQSWKGNLVSAERNHRDFSETIKGNYRFKYEPEASLPNNQCIWLVFVSETPTQRHSTGDPTQVPANWVSAPRVSLQCSFNYTDS